MQYKVWKEVSFLIVLLVWCFFQPFGCSQTPTAKEKAAEKAVGGETSKEVTAESVAEKSAESGVEVGPEPSKPEPKPEPRPEPKSEPKPEAGPEVGPEPVVEEGPDGFVLPDIPIPPNGIKITGGVSEFSTQGVGKGGKVSGAKVCVYKMPVVPCVLSGQQGEFTLQGVPKNKEVAIIVEKPGNLKFLYTLKTAEADIKIDVELQMIPNTLLSALALFVGTTPDTTKGFVVAYVSGKDVGKGLKDAVVSIDPKSGAGPFYTGSNNLPSRSAKATGPAGLGVAMNITPGNVKVKVTHPTNKNCTVDVGWPDAAGTARTPIEVGTVTSVRFICVQ